jgi:hypothetical protein
MSDIGAELESIFAWNPPVLHLDRGRSNRRYRSESEGYGSADVEAYLQTTFYNTHLAPHLICQRLVHIKYLHKKIAVVVDEKLRHIRDQGIVLPPPDPRSFELRVGRDNVVNRTQKSYRDELGVQDFYLSITSRYCVYIASTLALHPGSWNSVLKWSGIPQIAENNLFGGSLRVMLPSESGLGQKPKDSTAKNVRDFMDDERWKQLMEIRKKYPDLATWEIRSLSSSDVDNMLGVMTMAVASSEEGAFKWRFASGSPCVPDDRRSKTRADPGLDAPETLTLVETPWEVSEDTTSEKVPQTPNETVDAALRRGGSSLGLLHEEPEHDDYGTESNEEASDELSSEPIVPVRFTSQALIQDVGEFFFYSLSILM